MTAGWNAARFSAQDWLIVLVHVRIEFPAPTQKTNEAIISKTGPMAKEFYSAAGRSQNRVRARFGERFAGERNSDTRGIPAGP